MKRGFLDGSSADLSRKIIPVSIEQTDSEIFRFLRSFFPSLLCLYGLEPVKIFSAVYGFFSVLRLCLHVSLYLCSVSPQFLSGFGFSWFVRFCYCASACLLISVLPDIVTSPIRSILCLCVCRIRFILTDL